MKTFIGIDLGSTTTKAVVIDEQQNILGRGITNSRSNYDTAAKIAKQEALVSARFQLFRNALGQTGVLNGGLEIFIAQLERDFRLEQFLVQLADLEATCRRNAEGSRFGDAANAVLLGLQRVFELLKNEAPQLFSAGAKRRSDFFRDIAGSRYLAIGEQVAKESGMRYDMLCNVFDRSIIEVENRVYGDSIKANLLAALQRTYKALPETLQKEKEITFPIQAVLDTGLEETYIVGTGYGRARLPFSKEHIRSEILCHGLGAHMMHNGTATVLDIGGQDTKAIQVDRNGIVESFQMNDRCAAGCGRYLGYIADEMNMGLHELGPMAMKSTKSIKINSTCTVFAGAELRDRLSLGDKREDIMAGLHRAIILRAMSILARSGGIRNEFTFTGGVAKNEAAVKALKDLVRENYGELTLNINPDSIYTGALGGATFAWRAVLEEGKTAEARMTRTVGIDIGSGAVKTVLFEHSGDQTAWLAKRVERIRQRDPMGLARASYDEILAEAKLRPEDIDYTATTGEGENVRFATGHFYSMTTHARGAIYLCPQARAVVDVGALNGRAIFIDERGKVLASKMTSQCASGSGQFLENIARYLGVAIEEIGPLSKTSKTPEKSSSICAVLAETDVINMVSRGVATQDILKGIHLSMAGRLAKLLKVTGITKGTVLLTGGLALDAGLLAALQEELVNEKITGIEAMSHPDSIHAGAIGAALWGAFRHHRLRELQSRAAA